jgi:hypothetical protein
MKHTAMATLVVLLASFTAPMAHAVDDASVVRGGRLYDNWSIELKGRTPLHPNPAFKIGVGNGSRRPLPPNPVCGFPATGSPVSCFRIGIGAPIYEPLTL